MWMTFPYNKQVRGWSSESCGISCRVVKYMSTDVSEVRAASIIRAMRVKRRSISVWLHGGITQKTLNFILAAVRTWNLTYVRGSLSLLLRHVCISFSSARQRHWTFLYVDGAYKAVPLHAMEALGGERRYSSYSFLASALDGGERSASRPGRAFTPRERTPGTHCTGGWVGLRAGLDTKVTGKILCPCRGSTLDRPVVQPVARHYTAWATRLLLF
jgi:hypothetical protein